MTTDYQPDFDIDNTYGKQGEMFVADLVAGALNGRTEVKRDGVAPVTGNLYVEYECKRRDGWHPSGIATTKAEYFAFVIGDSGVAFFFETDVLKHLARVQLRRGNTAEVTAGSHPTKGVKVPLSAVVAYIRAATARSKEAS